MTNPNSLPEGLYVDGRNKPCFLTQQVFKTFVRYPDGTSKEVVIADSALGSGAVYVESLTPLSPDDVRKRIAKLEREMTFIISGGK